MPPNGQRGVLSPGERRAKIVEVINDAMRRNGYSPSQREIAKAAGLASASSVPHCTVRRARRDQISPATRRTRAYRREAGPGSPRCRGSAESPQASR